MAIHTRITVTISRPKRCHRRGTVRGVNAHKIVAGPLLEVLSGIFIMSAEWQPPSDPDVILRAPGGTVFSVHKLILSIASPVFRDMFSVPQPPPTDESSELPIVDVNDPPEALEAFLRIIYPIRNPLIDDVETLVSVLRLADKYDAKDALNVHHGHFPSMYTNFSPVETYAILCACGREKEAEAAARRVPFASLDALDSNPLLQLITTTQYQGLVSFMTARDERMRDIVRDHHRVIANDGYPTCNDPAHQLYSSTIVASLQAAFEADPCVRVPEALGIVSSALLTFSPCADDCRYNIRGLQKYAEGLLKELVEMAENLMWLG